MLGNHQAQALAFKITKRLLYFYHLKVLAGSNKRKLTVRSLEHNSEQLPFSKIIFQHVLAILICWFTKWVKWTLFGLYPAFKIQLAFAAWLWPLSSVHSKGYPTHKLIFKQGQEQGNLPLGASTWSFLFSVLQTPKHLISRIGFMGLNCFNNLVISWWKWIQVSGVL